jgi:predicted transport protein
VKQFSQFVISDDGFRKLNHARLDKEKSLQKIIEGNLKERLDMYFLESEYPTTSGGRIDTLAVDYTGAPVIIEYKLLKNENVINQALSYLKWLKAQKIDFFEMLIHKRLGLELAKKIQVDWKNPRVICIAESYNKFDIDTAEVVPLRIELLLYRHYENDILSLEPLTIPEKVTPPPKVVPVDGGGDPPEVPSLDAILAKANPKTRELFHQMRKLIFELDEAVVERVTNLYVSFRVTKSFVETYVLKNKIRFFMRPVEYDDPKGLVQRIPDGYNWTLNKSFYLERPEDIEYAMKLIGQAYKDVI